MAKLFSFMALLIVSAAIGQNNLEADVKKTVDTFFEGFHKGDTTLMKTVLAEKVLLQTTFKNKEGKDQLITDELSKLLSAIGNRPKD